MMQHVTDPRVIAFVTRLEKLEAGQRARLKRSAGCTLAESRYGSLGLFYSLLPSGVPDFQHENYFLLATLYPLADPGGSGDLGISMRRAQNKNNKKGLDRRLNILLDSDETQLPFRLRQTIYYLKSAGMTINFVQLLYDLLYWNHPDRFVQKRWAQSYYGN